MNEKEKIKKELEKLNSDLGRFQNEQPFSVPQNYFQSLPGEINKRIFRQKRLIPAIIKGRFIFRASLALATLMLIAYLVMVPVRNRVKNKKLYSDMESYLIENMDEATLIEFYEEAENDNFTNTTDLDEYILESLDENTLIEEL